MHPWLLFSSVEGRRLYGEILHMAEHGDKEYQQVERPKFLASQK